MTSTRNSKKLRAVSVRAASVLGIGLALSASCAKLAAQGKANTTAKPRASFPTFEGDADGMSLRKLVVG